MMCDEDAHEFCVNFARNHRNNVSFQRVPDSPDQWYVFDWSMHCKFAQGTPAECAEQLQQREKAVREARESFALSGLPIKRLSRDELKRMYPRGGR